MYIWNWRLYKHAVKRVEVLLLFKSDFLINHRKSLFLSLKTVIAIVKFLYYNYIFRYLIFYLCVGKIVWAPKEYKMTFFASFCSRDVIWISPGNFFVSPCGYGSIPVYIVVSAYGAQYVFSCCLSVLLHNLLSGFSLMQQLYVRLLLLRCWACFF